MDIAAWLWQRVERRDAPAVLAHALSLAPTRDALLRQAALTEQWDNLAAASEAAADIALTVGWSRSGPDAVTAICRWISAERTLRRVPPFDRSYPLAQAALAAWSEPSELATRLTASDPLSAADSAAFERSLSEETVWLQSVDDIQARLDDGHDAADQVLADDQTRSVLVRHAARTAEWAALSNLIADVLQGKDTKGSPRNDLEQVAQLSEWMAGHKEHWEGQQRTRAEIAETLAGTGQRTSTDEHNATNSHGQRRPPPTANPAAPQADSEPDTTARR